MFISINGETIGLTDAQRKTVKEVEDSLWTKDKKFAVVNLDGSKAREIKPFGGVVFVWNGKNYTVRGKVNLLYLTTSWSADSPYCVSKEDAVGSNVAL